MDKNAIRASIKKELQPYFDQIEEKLYKMVIKNQELEEEIKNLKKLKDSGSDISESPLMRRLSSKLDKFDLNILRRGSSTEKPIIDKIKFNNIMIDNTSHNKTIWSLASSIIKHQKVILVSGSEDGTCKVWLSEENTGLTTPLISYENHNSPVYSVDINPSNKEVICSSDASGFINIWSCRNILDDISDNVAEGTSKAIFVNKKALHVYKGDESPIFNVNWISDDKIVSGAHSGYIKIWDAFKEQNILTFSGHKGSITDLSLFPSLHLLASTSEDRSVRIWDIRSPDKYDIVKDAHKKLINCVDVLTDEMYFLTGGKDKLIKLWDLRHLQEPVRTKNFGSQINKISVFRQKDYICITEENGHVWIIKNNLERLKELTSMNKRKNLLRKFPVLCSTWIPKLHDFASNSVDKIPSLAVGSIDGRIYFWSMKETP